MKNCYSFYFKTTIPHCLFFSVLVNMLLLEPQSVLLLTNKNEVFKKMMSISKQNEIFEENLAIDLEWLKEEFEILFDSKIGNHTEMVQKIANNILDCFLENTDVGGNIVLLSFLDEALENIEKKYSILLK